MSTIRSHRFVDTDYKVTSRTHNQPNPQAKKPIPSNFTTIQNLLMGERKASTIYDDAWTKAEREFKKKKQSTLQYFKTTTPNERYIAVIAYTLELPPFYQDFNKKFRQLTDDSSWGAFPYKSFYYLLKLAKNGIVNNPEINQLLYRGLSVHFPSEPKVGEWFYFDYFASCTTDRATAEIYAGSGGTVIELKNGATEAIGIKYYSMYPIENEVLVFPTNKFKVEKFEKEGPKHRLVLVKAGTI